MKIGDKFKIGGKTWTVCEFPAWSEQYVILKNGKQTICRAKGLLK